MDPFQGRVAVVTGGASGIGAAMARAFAARGAKLVLADLDEAALAEREAELREAGAEVRAQRTDVTDRASVAALADAVFERFGRTHLLCNNAGIATPGEIAKAPHSDWEYTMNVNFWGVVHGLEAFLPRMLEQGEGGHVVNTASMAGLVGMKWLGIYCASKFAVVGLTESLARELRPHGLGASVLCPMMVETNIGANSQRSRPEDLRASESEAPPPPSQGAMQGSVKSAEEVAARVVRAVERGQLYVLTHEEQREILRRRAARLDAEFEPDRWEL